MLEGAKAGQGKKGAGEIDTEEVEPALREEVKVGNGVEVDAIVGFAEDVRRTEMLKLGEREGFKEGFVLAVALTESGETEDPGEGEREAEPLELTVGEMLKVGKVGKGDGVADTHAVEDELIDAEKVAAVRVDELEGRIVRVDVTLRLLKADLEPPLEIVTLTVVEDESEALGEGDEELD
jgi:hypothetical protein